MELAQGLQGEVSHKKAKAIFQNRDLNIERKEYYNFIQRKETKKLHSQEHLRFLLACLNQEDFRARFHEVYILND